MTIPQENQPLAALNDELENGERCAICNGKLFEPYGRPIACEDCGGDAVLEGGQ